jgi:hypothetical protein
MHKLFAQSRDNLTLCTNVKIEEHQAYKISKLLAQKTFFSHAFKRDTRADVVSIHKVWDRISVRFKRFHIQHNSICCIFIFSDLHCFIFAMNPLKLDSLPLEIWTRHILPVIPDLNILGVISQLSHYFHNIADSNEVWLICAQRLDLEYFLVGSKRTGASYKSLLTYHMRQRSDARRQSVQRNIDDFRLI